MDRKEKSHNQISSTATLGAEEDPAGDSKLTQSIWGRYGHSPGVIPTAGTLGVAGRITRLSTDRLPLLADIQRRWSITDASFSHGWSELPYAWPVGFADRLSTSTKVASPLSATRMPRFAQANPVPASARLIGPQPVASALAAKGRASPDHQAVERPLHRTVGSGALKAERALLHGSSGRRVPLSAEARNSMSMVTGRKVGPSIFPAGEGPMLHRAAAENQPVRETQTEVSIATSTGESGGAMFSSHLNGPAGPAIQGKAASVEPGPPDGGGPKGSSRVGRSPVSQGEGTSQVGPATRLALHPVEGGTESRAGTSGGHLAAGILQRFMDGPAGRVMPRMHGMPEPGRGIFDVLQRLEEPVASNEGVSRAGPTAGMEYHPAGAQDSMSPVTGRSLGLLSSPGEEVAMQQPLAGKARHEGKAQTDRPVTTKPDNLGAGILQRYLDGPAERAMQRMHGMAKPASLEGQGTFDIFQRVEGPVALREGAWHSNLCVEAAKPRYIKSQSDFITRFSERPGAAGQAIPLFGTAASTASRSNEAGCRDGASIEMPFEMPLVSPVGASTGEGGNSGTAMRHAQPNTLIARASMPLLQRAAAESHTAMPETNVPGGVSSQSADQFSPPTMAESDLNEINLERLADEVCAIIERRITIERERLGH